MKIRNFKNLTQKIIIAVIMILLFNFIVPNYMYAIDGMTTGIDNASNFTSDNISSFGGIFLGPIIDLFTGLNDSIIVLLQVCMYGNENIRFDAKPFISSRWMVRSTGFNPEDYNMAWDKEPEEDQIVTIDADSLDHGWWGLDTYTIPIIKYSPEKIFSNQVPALDANFISPKSYEGAQENKSIAIKLRDTISSWYSALRNLVIVGLLSVLVYVGIRMMLTSVASDKAKYKQMLMDWFIALCLVFFLHYIMSFTMTVVDMITEGLGEGLDSVYVQITDGSKTIQYKTDLTGLCRQQIEYADLGVRLTYLVFYVALTAYTFIFTWKYMKRAITMAFLTLMAPLVTLTYPIDKMGDGKAQAFNMWLKEYIFNALLQPFHLIIYTIFLGSSMNIAIENPLYAILFLAFITPAEKILRKFFGFDKASTAGASFAGGFSGAAAFNIVKGLMGKGANRLASGKQGGQGSNHNIRQQEVVKDDNGPKGYEAFAGSGVPPKQVEPNNNEPPRIGTEEQKEMLDAYDEGFGTDEYAPLFAEEQARVAYNNQTPGMQYTPEELREQGWDEDTIREWTGYKEPTQPPTPEPTQPPTPEPTQPQDLGIVPIRTSTPLPNESGQRPLPKRTIRGFLGGATVGALQYIDEGFNKRFTTREGLKNTAAFAGRAAVRTLSTGAGIVTGIGLGMAGGELEDVAKYGAAGAALGATTLNNVVLGAGRKIANSGVVQAAMTGGREAYYGGVNQAALAQQEHRLRQEGQLREYIGNNITHDDGTRLSRKELDTYENRAIQHYNSGVTDFSKIEKTLKVEDQIKTDLARDTKLEEDRRNQMARMQAQTIARIADDVSGDKLATDEKYRKGRRDEFSAGLLRANPQLSKKEVKDQTEQMMQLLCKYKKVTYIKDE